MLKAENVVKTFGQFRALDGLDIYVPKGAVYGLVGPNGSGKSTIIRHFAGVYRQDSGRVLVDGAPVFENCGAKERMAIIPDDICYFPSATISDMKDFYRGIYKTFDLSRYVKLRSVFELSEKQPLRRMSKGQQKQAAFWLALCRRPEILILDEPVDGLDPVMRRQVWSLVMGDVAENGTTVLISSHNLRELEDVCDRVGIINHGRTILQRSLESLQENVVKVQMVCSRPLPDNLNVLHRIDNGKLMTLILRGRIDSVRPLIESLEPVFYDIVPLTLEEIFVYELGGENYAVKDIAL